MDLQARAPGRGRALAGARGLPPVPGAAAALLCLLIACAPGDLRPPAALWPFGGPDYPDPAEDRAGAAAEVLSRAIRLPTVSPEGNERPLAGLLARVARQQGLEARVVETVPSQPRRAAVWARLRGTGARRPVILLSHLDVVGADRSEWTVDPFEGVISGGYVVGRGALDAKGVAVTHLFALIELARRGARLDRDVIFLATPGEEAGGREGAARIVRDHRELLGNAEYLLTEGGGVRIGGEGSPNVWGVTVSEKSPCWVRVTARGPPGHSATAPRDSAVPRLVTALARLIPLETQIRVLPEVARMFAALAPSVDPEDRAGYTDLARALREDPAFRARFLADRSRAALVRDTVTITVLEGSPVTNVVPAEASAHLDARLLPGERCEDFIDGLRPMVGAPGMSLETILSFPSRSSPADTALFRAIRQVAGETDPEALVVPRVIAGFTDAHYFRDLGIVAYGFVPRWLTPAETQSIHGPDERISIENLERGIDTTVRILQELAETGTDGRGRPPPGPAAARYSTGNTPGR